MSSEHRGERPSSDPNANGRQPFSESWGSWKLEEEDTQPRPTVTTSSTPPLSNQMGSQPSPDSQYPDVDPQFSHREHVTGVLPATPSEAPLFQPAYAPYPPFQGQPAQRQAPPAYPPYQPQGYLSQAQGYPPYPVYQGYPPPPYPPYAAHPEYSGYPGYAWPPQPPEPKRDGYLFGIAITSFIGSILVVLAGLGCLLLLALFTIIPNNTLNDSQYFASITFFIALAAAGLLGGGFSLYHSIRSVFLNKPSSAFSLPSFWIFVLLYLIVLSSGYLLLSQKDEVAFPVLTLLLIVCAGTFPALAVMALGVRRLRARVNGKENGRKVWDWPTSWRRFTLAIVSGATAAIVLAAALEFALQAIIVRGQSTNVLLCIDRPDAPNCQNQMVYNLLFIIVALVGPIVEETVKPLAVVLLMPRIRSAAEAFVLGLACGIGFDLIETTGYISSGYHGWLSVALVRTSAGLLHGFGAAMVALGWYYLVHGKKYRLLIALACWLYAVIQHAVWNGSWGLALLPAPVGPAINNWNVNLGFTTVPFYLIINFLEALFMLAFFIYMTGRLRPKTPSTSSPPAERGVQSMSAQRVIVPG